MSSKHEQKEKQALNEVSDENLTSWDKQVELKIEKTKAFQDLKVNKTDTFKDTTNITTNNTSKKQVTLDNTAEIEDATRQNSLNSVTNKEEASKHEQKEKQVPKEVLGENLASWNKQVELEIKKMKASQDQKVNNTFKVAANITTNNTFEEQIMLDNAVETEITSQELNKMTNEQ
ncbi:8218_t:CDS:2, partial [Cetraspora pellucida]